ncbi:unnamed protein product (macronuclear) [Paramecium tetraurelia]|uniref:Glucosamine 6-phosphate N-acetyltransferase n=1 Tax=Paramecium tetraurelia TaxID=5888 RepID=A0CYW9_PARTE|nr:uncharacterized protein GSPATT00011587001 [Paramecium tetraurelia]CAK75986.1 unnamed protein product [Paramecium tetraurelia]|eukprot:XP_001443383.1 hypothetical protein (macronuclear) [Paramecium tetraurelia strain d4-2]
MENQTQVQQQFICRKLELEDYQKGFLLCLSYLTKTPDLPFEKFKEIYNNYPGCVYVVEDVQAKLIASTISLVIEQNIFETKYYIENVVTHPDYRGKGFVRELMEKIKSDVKDLVKKENGENGNENNQISLELYCKQETKGLYEKLGFQEDGFIASKYV